MHIFGFKTATLLDNKLNSVHRSHQPAHNYKHNVFLKVPTHNHLAVVPSFE
jgi:hypothetical protein